MRLAERNFVIAGGDRNILGVDKQIKKTLRAAQKENVDPMARIELADLLEVYNVGFDEYAGAKRGTWICKLNLMRSISPWRQNLR